jgi:hypothetical protein
MIWGYEMGESIGDAMYVLCAIVIGVFVGVIALVISDLARLYRRGDF